MKKIDKEQLLAVQKVIGNNLTLVQGATLDSRPLNQSSLIEMEQQLIVAWVKLLDFMRRNKVKGIVP